MNELPILSILILLPIVGIFFMTLIRNNNDQSSNNLKHTALWISFLNFLISLYLLFSFNQQDADFQFEERYFWIEYGISYHLGVDGISILFIVLTTMLVPICILASYDSIKFSVKEYLIAFLALETFMIGVFCSLDLVLFYLFFEGGLIPMFLIIGIWGGERRVYSTFKFFLYTLAGSVFMLLAIIYIFITAGTTDVSYLLDYNFTRNEQIVLWLAFFASFMVKIPMWPFHTWLPDAHVEAPTAGSVILAGVLLKMAGYGFIRFSIGLFPIASENFVPLIYTLSLIAIVYTSLVALMQDDMKKLIAYSSVAHMGYVTIGLFTFKQEGIDGAIIQMLSHGLVSAALFLCIGVLYDRMHTRMISDYGGIVSNMPKFAFIFMVFTLASIGLPGTSGFVGEFLVLIAAYEVSGYLAFTTGLGMVLGAAYMLWLYKRVVFGKLENSNLIKITDLDRREYIIFVPIILGVFWLGIYPETFTIEFRETVLNLVNSINTRAMN